MEIPWLLLIAYTMLTFFSFYQKLHIKNFRGESEVFLMILNIFTLIATVFGLAFLVYWAWKVSWTQAFMIFIIAFLVRVLWFPIEAKLGLRNAYPVPSMIGFFVIPISGVAMWLSLP